MMFSIKFLSIFDFHLPYIRGERCSLWYLFSFYDKVEVMIFYCISNWLYLHWCLIKKVIATISSFKTQGCPVCLRSRSYWPQMGRLQGFFRSHFWKSPGFFSFGANLTYLGTKPDSPIKTVPKSLMCGLLVMKSLHIYLSAPLTWEIKDN